MIARSLQNLQSEIKRKAEDYSDIAKSLNKTTDNGGDPIVEINTKRLDRIDAELMRLEGELLKNETSGEKQDIAFLAKRLGQLRKQREDLEKTIRTSTVRSAELDVRKQEISELQSIANEMSRKLEAIDIDLGTPPNIRQIQVAAIKTGK
jgi:chromosome segregation ATPase